MYWYTNSISICVHSTSEPKRKKKKRPDRTLDQGLDFGESCEQWEQIALFHQNTCSLHFVGDSKKSAEPLQAPKFHAVVSNNQENA